MSFTLDTSRIVGIQFSLLSPEEILKTSVVEVVSRDTFSSGNKPVIGGLFDPRMGVLDPGFICPTDGLNYIHTPGYFGHIRLVRPVFFIQHLDEIKDIHKCICFKCSKLLINKDANKHLLELPQGQRWRKVLEKCKTIKRCGSDNLDGCGNKRPSKIQQEGMATLLAKWEITATERNNNKRELVVKLTPEDVLQRFRRISDEDIHFMGFHPKWSRPEWMVCTILPVPPPAMRPSVKHDAQQRSEDDITHIYGNIIKTNNDLRNKIEKNDNAVVIENTTTILQYFVAMIVNNKTKGSLPLQQRSGRPLQCIMSRINSKTGRIRGNLMGKRVNYSARSVITGDPNLSIQQLGVPLRVAKNITKPVVVNERNRDFLIRLVRNGPDEYPGAKTIERCNGTLISLRNIDRETIVLENGDIVNRHMMDGDCVLFNRQPSLHRMSMMGHIAKIMMVGDTFRMNVGDTKPYNADFDGDEMNMHMPQNILAETELRNIANIPNQIVSPAKNSPIIGIFQDSLLGSFRFTRKGIDFNAATAMNLLMRFPNVRLEKLSRVIWGEGEGSGGPKRVSNFQILSQIMPALTLTNKTKLFSDGKDAFCDSNNVMEIRNGEYIRGQIEGSMFAGTSKGLIHRIFNDFSPMEAADFIDNLQAVITEYMKTSAYSVGVNDLIADAKTYTDIRKIIEQQKMNVQDMNTQIHMGTFENNTSNTNRTEFEYRVNNLLNKATEEAGKIVRQSLDPNNRFVQIIISGSKGSPLNLSQMMACVGQTNVEGKRVPYGLENRSLPHYCKYDDSPNARGFIENSYISGLTAEEVFFHAMGGRIGLIDTACKTSTTGYIQRRLIKMLEDGQVRYDMSVRNSKDKILQFRYGDDNVDPCRIENQSCRLIEMSYEDIYAHYDIGAAAGVSPKAIYTEAALRRYTKQAADFAKICRERIDYMIKMRNAIVEKVFKNRSNENVVRVPVAFQYLIQNVQGQLNLNTASETDLTPFEAHELVEEYMKKISSYRYIAVNDLFKTLYYFYLSPKDIVERRRFNRNALVLLLETILLKFKQSLIQPGEMVGIIAGQSIGEPTTQLTLNTFHLAGSAKANATQGVPRIEEILRLTKNPKSPSITVFFRDTDQYNKDRVIHHAKVIKHMRLVDVVKNVEFVFDPIDRRTRIDTDQMFMNQFYEFENIVEESLGMGGVVSHDRSKWILRLTIHRETMLDSGITMDDIHYAISNGHMGDSVFCTYSDFNTDNLIFRIGFSTRMFAQKKGAKSLDQYDDIHLLKSFQDSLLNGTILRGISGIKNALPREIKNTLIEEDGRFVNKATWVLDTTGSNLMGVLAMDFIDKRRTYTNDIYEIFEVLGIEATRQAIMNEMEEVMENSGSYINYHHLSMLADRMTCNAGLVPIFRTGMLADDVGPIAKATFEVQTEVFLEAARRGELDPMRGVSANVMCGQTGFYGTHGFQLILDTVKFAGLKKSATATAAVPELAKDLYKMNESECSAVQEIENKIGHLKQGLIPVACQDDYDMGF